MKTTSNKQIQNKIIQQRIQQLKREKDALLHLTKKQRGNDVKDIEETIARLGRWDKELEVKKIKEMKRIHLEKFESGMKSMTKALKGVTAGMSEGMKRFKKACELINPTFCQSINYNHDHIKN